MSLSISPAFWDRVRTVSGRKEFLVTRVVEFSAAHRLYREDYSETENREAFGACANPFGHGHNYLLECTFGGPLDPETGMVVHFNRLKGLLHELVEAPLDHRHLNLDVPFLKGILPTSENLVAVLWRRLDDATKDQPWRLKKLRLSSTDRNWVEYSESAHE